MRCYIIDDQEHGIINLSRRILKTPGLTLAGSDTDPVVAINKILSGAVQVDIVFADVEMPGMTGLELARKINDRAAVIIVTGHVDYAIEAIDIGVVGYLTKPISTVHFLHAVERAKQWLENRDRMLARRPDSIWIPLDRHHDVLIAVSNIIWLQAINKYVTIHLSEGEPLIIASALNAFDAILPGALFLRIHKSHVVNLSFIVKRSYNQVILTTGLALDIGPSYMDVYKNKMNVL